MVPIVFYYTKLFLKKKEKNDKFHQIYCKMWMKKILNEGNQIYNFKTVSVRTFVIPFNYGSGSATSKSYGS